MMKVAIGGKSKALLAHLTHNPPENNHETYEQWEQEDLIVFSWLIQNIEPNLASNLTSFSTAKLLWDALITTYSSGGDKLQIYDLYVKATEIKQGNMNLEELWIRLQGIWGDLEIKDPNPMECAADITRYNKIRAEHKLFQFLNALDKKHDAIKRELLRLTPLPTAEEAYAAVRKEAAHRQILGLSSGGPSTGQDIATGLVANDGKRHPHHLTHANRNSNLQRIDKSKLKCSRCGKMRHTIEQCFEIKGYPEWWIKPGKAAAAVDKPTTTITADQATATTTDQGFGGIATTTGTTLKPCISLFSNIESIINHRVDKPMKTHRDHEAVRESKEIFWDNKKVGGDNWVRGNQVKGKGYPKSKEIFWENKKVGGDYSKKGKGYPFHLTPNKLNGYMGYPLKDVKIEPKKNNKPTRDGWIKVKKGPTHKSDQMCIGLGSPKSVKNVSGSGSLLNRPKDVTKFNNPISCQNKYSFLTKIPTDLSETNIISNSLKSKSWILDCGATDTMTFDEKDISFKTKPRKNKIQTANGEIIQVKSGGTIEISPTIKLPNCLYIPALSHKLLSVSHITKELNCKVLMYPTFCILQDIRTGLLIGRGTEQGGLYYVDEVSQQGTVSLAHGTPTREAWLWHRRLGHPSAGYLHALFPSLFPSNIVLNCETCILAKSHRSTFKPSNTRKDMPFALIHSDVWGPAPVNGGEKPSFNKNIQILRSDNGGEFVNTSMKLFCESNGIIHQTSCAHTPEQNGVAERKNQLLLEMTRALLIESKVPKSFWPEALASATYLINRLPTKVLGTKTPRDTLSQFHTLPTSLSIEPRIFGCSVFVHIPKTERTKLDPCAEKCVMVGYGVNQKGYRCYSPRKRHVFTTMNCDFIETEYFYNTQPTSEGEKESNDTLSWVTWTPKPHNIQTESPNPSPESPKSPNPNPESPNSTPESSNPSPESPNPSPESPNIEPNGIEPNGIPSNDEEDIQTNDTPLNNESTSAETNERYVLPQRINRGVPPKRYSPEKENQRSSTKIQSVLYSEKIPNTVEQALKSEKWRKAMEEEMEALKKSDTWEIKRSKKQKVVSLSTW
ncbi:uncharacterized protein [Rutidosis leptorrhynchoides]|uniref:uncharacterized protein n=1 Tax=Rutidosis leptorrhynchoides TaxID=125765 RepID=UPI003A992A70